MREWGRGVGGGGYGVEGRDGEREGSNRIGCVVGTCKGVVSMSSSVMSIRVV